MKSKQAKCARIQAESYRGPIQKPRYLVATFRHWRLNVFSVRTVMEHV